MNALRTPVFCVSARLHLRQGARTLYLGAGACGRSVPNLSTSPRRIPGTVCSFRDRHIPGARRALFYGRIFGYGGAGICVAPEMGLAVSVGSIDCDCPFGSALAARAANFTSANESAQRLEFRDALLQFARNFICVLTPRKANWLTYRNLYMSWTCQNAIFLLEIEEPS